MGRRGAEELYDISRDTDCIDNLVGKSEYDSLRSALAEEMEARLREEGDPRMEGRGELFDSYPNMCGSRQFYNRFRAGEQAPHKWINDTDFDPDAENK